MFKAEYLKNNVALGPHTTFRIGGPADFFYEPRNTDDLCASLIYARDNNIPFFILGDGSNILISDQGFRGLVIKFKGNSILYENGILKFDASVDLSSLVDFAFKNSLSGLEWATGIPGTIGGAICGNAGAFGKTIENNSPRVKVFDVENNKTLFFDADKCEFSYRYSLFKINKNYIILSGEIILAKQDQKTIAEEMNKNLALRKNNPLEPSAGCVFRNAKLINLSTDMVAPIEAEYHDDFLRFLKIGTIPAGWLIEKTGLKEQGIGGAKISEKHANFIINANHATANDTYKLIGLIKQKVKDKFNIELNEEIEYVGF